MYSYNYAIDGGEKSSGDNSLIDFNKIENSYITGNENDLGLYCGEGGNSLIDSVAEKRDLDINTLELKKILDISSVVGAHGFSYYMYGLNIMAYYNRLFYRFLAESFVLNFKSNLKNRFNVLSVFEDKDIDYFYYYSVSLLFNNKYIQEDANSFKDKVKERLKENYSSRILLEEAIKEKLFTLRGTEVFNDDLEFLCQDYLSNNVDYVPKKKRIKILLAKKEKILKNGYD